MGNLFDSFFRRDKEGRERKRPLHGANIKVELYVALEQVAAGGEEVVHVLRPTACPGCHGTGGEGGVAPRKCETCGGTGRITHSRREEKEHLLIQQIIPCSACHGRGSIIDHPSRECNGSGEVEQEEVLTVKIPVGIEKGMVLRIPGKACPAHLRMVCLVICMWWCAHGKMRALSEQALIYGTRSRYRLLMLCWEPDSMCRHCTARST